MTLERDEPSHLPDVLQRIRAILQIVEADTSPGVKSQELHALRSDMQDVLALLEDQQARLKQMHHELVQARSQYATLYHGTPMGIITLDSSMRMAEINRAAVLMLNYSREQMLRKDVRSLIHTDDQDIFFQHRHLLDTMQTPQTFELRMLRADGTHVFLQIDLLPYPPGNNVYHCQLFLLDISQQKIFEAQKREYALRLRQLTAHSPAVLWLRNVDNQQVLAITPSFAWLPQEAIDYFPKAPANFIHVVHPEDTERLSMAFHRQKQTGGLDEECRLIGKDGAVYQVHVRTFPVYDERGNIYRIAGVAEDITARKQAVQERDVRRQQANEARIVAEQAAGRMICLVRIAQRFSHVTTPAQMADILVKEIAIQSGVSLAVLFQLNAERTGLHLVSSGSVVNDYPPAFLSLLGPCVGDDTIPLSLHLPYTTVAQSGSPRWDETRAALLAEFPMTEQVASLYGAWATLPLLVQGEVIGVLVLAFADEHPFAEDERTFQQVLAQQCAQTLTRCQLQDEIANNRVQMQALSRNLVELQQQQSAPAQADTEPAARIRVLLVDKHTLIREGIRSLLASLPTVEVIGEADNGEEALRLLADDPPHIVLIDITIGDNGGLAATRQITDQFPDVRVIVFSVYTHAEYVLQALHAGVDGYLVKQARTQDLYTAIESVMRGDTYLSPQISCYVVEGYRGRVGNIALKEVLSPRQIEVVRLLANGATTQSIAGELNISVKTVEAHRTQAMKRLGISDFANLVRYAIRMGWVGE